MYPRNATTPPRIAIGAVVQISDGAVQSTGVSVVVRAEGGYTGQELRILYSVIAFQELSRFKEMIRAIDPEAFVVVTETMEVMGKRIGNQPHLFLRLFFNRNLYFFHVFFQVINLVFDISNLNLKNSNIGFWLLNFDCGIDTHDQALLIVTIG